jgi:hypothetical protein
MIRGADKSSTIIKHKLNTLTFTIIVHCRDCFLLKETSYFVPRRNNIKCCNLTDWFLASNYIN